MACLALSEGTHRLGQTAHLQQHMGMSWRHVLGQLICTSKQVRPPQWGTCRTWTGCCRRPSTRGSLHQQSLHQRLCELSVQARQAKCQAHAGRQACGLRTCEHVLSVGALLGSQAQHSAVAVATPGEVLGAIVGAAPAQRRVLVSELMQHAPCALKEDIYMQFQELELSLRCIHVYIRASKHTEW